MSDLISRQAAIDLLKQMRKDGEMVPWEGKDVFARIRKLPATQPDVPDTNVGDTINRQAAIDAVMDEFKRVPTTAIRAKTRLGSLPAQPEIIRCKECKYSEHWYKDKRRCFLWAEDGIDVFEDGYCNYAEGKEE